VTDRYVCIHAHFYQPPRENPWLEAIEIQDSAYPYHDWNERVTAESYAPNAASRILDGEQKPVCVVDGKEVVNLASNNYLGLTTHKALRKAAVEAAKKDGAGAGAVRTIAGTMQLHMQLEEQIAKFKNVEACVVFQSGFTANAGTVSAVLGKEDLIVSDELNHASIIDGARLSKATIKVFKHKDVADCERILQEHASFTGKKLIITDGVFSMDGDLAPLPELTDRLIAAKVNGVAYETIKESDGSLPLLTPMSEVATIVMAALSISSRSSPKKMRCSSQKTRRRSAAASPSGVWISE